jgi:hypothetical protein
MEDRDFADLDVREIAQEAADICWRISWQGYFLSDAPRETTRLRALYPPDAVRQALRARQRFGVKNPTSQPESIWPEAEALVRDLIPNLDQLLAGREASARARTRELQTRH